MVWSPRSRRRPTPRRAGDPTARDLWGRVARWSDMSIPPYEPPKSPGSPNTSNMLLCPKCAGVMRTYERNGVHLEQCDTCRGIFLDFGELESLTQLENR